MTVKGSIQDSFKDLVVTLPYRKITVSLICQKAAISRPTFYDCFDNKEAIIQSIVDDDIINPQKNLLQMIPLEQLKSRAQISMELLYGDILKNTAFYRAINRVDDGALLTRVLTNAFVSLIGEIIREYSLPDDMRRYATFFFANSNASLISQWIKNGMDLAPSRLSQFFNMWLLHWWEEIIPHKPPWLSSQK